MNKKIKGYEVMKLIAEKKIKEGQKLIYTSDDIEIYWDGSSFKYVNSENYILDTIGDIDFATGEFEILEDEEERDIKMFEQEWFEYYEGTISVVDVDLAVKMNEIVDKLNKLDKKINKEE